MRRTLQKVLWLTLIGGFVAAVWLVWAIFTSPDRSWIEGTMRDVGGLAPIPQSARDVQVESHWFKVTAPFSAPAGDIEQWLNNSPRMQGVTGEQINGDKRIRYSHREGVRLTEVIVDESTGRVDVIVHSDPL